MSTKLVSAAVTVLMVVAQVACYDALRQDLTIDVRSVTAALKETCWTLAVLFIASIAAVRPRITYPRPRYALVHSAVYLLTIAVELGWLAAGGVMITVL